MRLLLHVPARRVAIGNGKSVGRDKRGPARDWAGPRQSGSQPHRTLSLLCTLHCEIDLKKRHSSATPSPNCRKLSPRQGFLFDASERYAQARPSDLWHGGDQRTSGAALGCAEKSAAHERAAEPSESERWPVSWPATRSASLTSADTCLPAWSRVTAPTPASTSASRSRWSPSRW